MFEGVVIRRSEAPAVGFGDIVAPAPSGRPKRTKVAIVATAERGATMTRNLAVPPAGRTTPGSGTTISKSALGIVVDEGAGTGPGTVEVVDAAAPTVLAMVGTVVAEAGMTARVAPCGNPLAAATIGSPTRVLVVASDFRFVTPDEARRRVVLVVRFLVVARFTAIVRRLVVVAFRAIGTVATVGAACTDGFEVGITTVAASSGVWLDTDIVVTNDATATDHAPNHRTELRSARFGRVTVLPESDLRTRPAYGP